VSFYSSIRNKLWGCVRMNQNEMQSLYQRDDLKCKNEEFYLQKNETPMEKKQQSCQSHEDWIRDTWWIIWPNLEEEGLN